MTKRIDFDTMSDRCIAAGQAVMKVGSPELQAAMRVVLTVLGHEIAAGTSRSIPVQANRAPLRRGLN